MIEFNGRKYAKNANELVNSLFTGSGTAHGMYKTTKNGTKIYKPDGSLFAYIVHNAKQGYFAVSAFTFHGKPFYMNGTTAEADHFLGFADMRGPAQRDTIRATFS